MAGASSFEQIEAWQAARTLVREIYQLCNRDPMAKDWGIRNQLTRAAVSTMSNIAEGYARKSDREFARYLDMARASCVEVHSLLYVTLDVGYIDAQCFARFTSLIDAVQSKIAGMTNYLRKLLQEN